MWSKWTKIDCLFVEVKDCRAHKKENYIQNICISLLKCLARMFSPKYVHSIWLFNFYACRRIDNLISYYFCMSSVWNRQCRNMHRILFYVLIRIHMNRKGSVWCHVNCLQVHFTFMTATTQNRTCDKKTPTKKLTTQFCFE